MKPDDIIGYEDVVRAEHARVQKGMNYNLGRGNSVLLMSTREDAPYEDMIEEQSGTLIYEGHDVPRTPGGPDPKSVDQPMLTPGGTWTENGKFFRAAIDYKSGLGKSQHS